MSMDTVNNPNEIESQVEKKVKLAFQETTSSKLMIDPYKLAWFNTGLIDPDIIIAKCERFGPVIHCRQFHGISFPLFKRRQ